MPKKTSYKKTPTARPPAKKSKLVRPVPETKSEWSILCYFVGDGLISSSMISQLKGITDAGFEEHTNVLVYFDPNCNGRRARIFDVNARRKEEYSHPVTGKKTIIGDGEDPFVRDIADDYHVPGLPQIPAAITLRYFLEYAKTYYPAKNYMLFLVGHGVIVGNDAFLPDPDDQSAITLSDLGWILRDFGKKVRAENDEFHLVGFHSCSMSSVELLCELEASARYMIGTQGPAFPGSWPYRQLLKKILLAIDKSVGARNGSNGAQERPQASNGGHTQAPNELLRKILNGLQDLSHYNAEDFGLAGFSSDIALCSLDSNKIKSLREAIRTLSQVLMKGIKQPATKNCILLAHLESQSYFNENYTDLIDFCECLARNCNGPEQTQKDINQACRDVIKALRNDEKRDEDYPKTEFDRLIVSSDFYGPAYQYSNGLSIYFPWKSPSQTVTDTYQAYKFTQDLDPESWLGFLKEYFTATQRPVREVRYPRSISHEMVNFIKWQGSGDLLRTMSEKQLLSLGPRPSKMGELSKVGGELSKVGGELSKVGDELSKISGKLSGERGGELSQVGAELLKVGEEMSKVGGELSDKVGGEISNVGEKLTNALDFLSKVGGELSDNGNGAESGKVVAELANLFGGLSKVGGELSKVGGELSGKVGGELSKVGGELSKVGGELSSKVGGELSKVGGEMSKVGGEFGGLLGQTVIKNFAEPQGKFVTSRNTAYTPESAQKQPDKLGGAQRYNCSTKKGPR